MLSAAAAKMARFVALRSPAAARASPARAVAVQALARDFRIKHLAPCRARTLVASPSTSRDVVAAVALSDDVVDLDGKKKQKPPPPLPPLVPRGSPPPGGDWGSAAAYLVDKPRGWSSHDACAKLRGALRYATGDRKVKVGHAGTLDPLATGLLIVCVGRGTKAVDRFVAMEKEYTGTLRLGLATPSLDAETADLLDDDDVDSPAPLSPPPAPSLERAVRFPWRHVTDEDLERAARSLTGQKLLQSPPMYSAVSVGGERLYRAARRGESVERPRREISVSAFEVKRRAERYREGDEGEGAPTSSTPSSSSSSPSSSSTLCPDVDFRVECSKGTYVRVLAADLGTAAGTAAHLVALRRTRIGESASVDDAWPLLELVAAVRRRREEEEAAAGGEGREAPAPRTPKRAYERL